MWSRFRRLPLSVRFYIGLASVLAGIFGLTWWSLINAEAAPCAPVVCVPLPTLPAPQPSGFATPPPQPGAFATPTPSARPPATPSPSPGVGQPPGQAPLPGQDVGLTALAQGAENGASGLSKQLNSQLNAPNAGGNWFLPIYNKMTTIGVWILLIALLLAVLQYIASRRLGLVASSWFGWAPGSIGITAVAIAVTNLTLAITDALCAYMLAGLDLGGFLARLAGALVLVAAGAGMLGTLPFVGFILAGTLAVIIVGLIAELLMRQVVIYVCLAWLPLTASSSAWAPARSWLYRLATLQLAVILAKFAVVVCLALGVAAFAANPSMVGPLGDPNLVAVVMGVIILGLALLSPFALLRLLPHDFEHAVQAVSSRARRRVMRTVRRTGSNINQRFSGGAGIAGGAAKLGIPLASKGVKAAKTAKLAGAGAGTAVIPLSLVMSGGRIVASRGGKVVQASGASKAAGRPSGGSGKASTRQPTPSGRVTPRSAPPSPPAGNSGPPAPGPGPRRPLRSPSPPGPNNPLPPPPPILRRGP